MRTIIKELKIFIPAIIAIVIVASAAPPTLEAVDIGTINTVKARDTMEIEDVPISDIAIKKDTKDAEAASAEHISVSKDVSLDGQKFRDGIYTGVGKGFRGDIHVEVSIEGGKISTIRVTQHSDDEPYISNATALVENIVATQSVAVDTVSGATYSSKGIISAVKNALEKALIIDDASLIDTDDAVASENTSNANPESSPTVKDNSLDGQTYKDGTYTGVGKGFRGNIHVKVTIKAGKISNIKVTQHSDDEPYINNAMALVENIVETQSVAVDTVSGATYSSNGIIDAVKDALKKAIDATDASSTDSDDADTTEESSKSNPDSSSTTEDTSLDGQTYKDGTYTGVSKGFNGDIHVEVTIKTGKISNIKVIQHSDDEPYISNAMALVQNIVKKQSPAVDAVSGATYSSRGIINAVKNALKKAVVKPDPSLDETEDSTTSDPVVADTNPGSTEADNNYDTVYGQYVDGTYVGKARGYKSIFTATIVIINGNIDNIDIEQADDEAFYSKCISIIQRIITHQTTEEIDTVSGCTSSSNGILNSVKAALAKALPPEEADTDVEGTNTDAGEAEAGVEEDVTDSEETGE